MLLLRFGSCILCLEPLSLVFTRWVSHLSFIYCSFYFFLIMGKVRSIFWRRCWIVFPFSFQMVCVFLIPFFGFRLLLVLSLVIDLYTRIVIRFIDFPTLVTICILYHRTHVEYSVYFRWICIGKGISFAWRSTKWPTQFLAWSW